MSENPYETMMPQGPFGKAVDKILAEMNAQPYTDEQRAADEENAQRWAAISAGQEAAKGYGVVLPMALAQDLLKILRGEPTVFPAESLERSFEQAISNAQTDKEQQA